tara:strand:- start:8973 stop:10997 length:2025 start_codon:yes stop_codon:yes gene_type:complete
MIHSDDRQMKKKNVLQMSNQNPILNLPLSNSPLSILPRSNMPSSVESKEKAAKAAKKATAKEAKKEEATKRRNALTAVKGCNTTFNKAVKMARKQHTSCKGDLPQVTRNTLARMQRRKERNSAKGVNFASVFGSRNALVSKFEIELKSDNILKAFSMRVGKEARKNLASQANEFLQKFAEMCLTFPKNKPGSLNIHLAKNALKLLFGPSQAKGIDEMEAELLDKYDATPSNDRKSKNIEFEEIMGLFDENERRRDRNKTIKEKNKKQAKKQDYEPYDFYFKPTQVQRELRLVHNFERFEKKALHLIAVCMLVFFKSVLTCAKTILQARDKSTLRTEDIREVQQKWATGILQHYKTYSLKLADKKKERTRGYTLKTMHIPGHRRKPTNWKELEGGLNDMENDDLKKELELRKVQVPKDASHTKMVAMLRAQIKKEKMKDPKGTGGVVAKTTETKTTETKRTLAKKTLTPAKKPTEPKPRTGDALRRAANEPPVGSVEEAVLEDDPSLARNEGEDIRQENTEGRDSLRNRNFRDVKRRDNSDYSDDSDEGEGEGEDDEEGEGEDEGEQEEEKSIQELAAGNESDSTTVPTKKEVKEAAKAKAAKAEATEATNSAKVANAAVANLILGGTAAKGETAKKEKAKRAKAKREADKVAAAQAAQAPPKRSTRLSLNDKSK